MTKAVWMAGVAAVVSVACGDQAPKATMRGDTPVPDYIGDPRVSPASATLHIGDTLRLSFTFGCGSTPVANRWSTSRDTIATVDSAGLVRGVHAGVVTIISSVIADPNVKGAAAITVVP
jgi:Bacterial Ig-like domain (group 2)